MLQVTLQVEWRKMALSVDKCIVRLASIPGHIWHESKLASGEGRGGEGGTCHHRLCFFKIIVRRSFVGVVSTLYLTQSPDRQSERYQETSRVLTKREVWAYANSRGSILLPCGLPSSYLDAHLPTLPLVRSTMCEILSPADCLAHRFCICSARDHDVVFY